MATYREKEITEAEQFLYIDGIDGPKTQQRAGALGLSTNGTSVLWEIKTPWGWKIVNHGDYIITGFLGRKQVMKKEDFESKYEEVKR